MPRDPEHIDLGAIRDRLAVIGMAERFFPPRSPLSLSCCASSCSSPAIGVLMRTRASICSRRNR